MNKKALGLVMLFALAGASQATTFSAAAVSNGSVGITAASSGGGGSTGGGGGTGGGTGGGKSGSGGTSSEASSPSAPNIVLAKHVIDINVGDEEPTWTIFIKHLFDDDDTLVKHDVVIEDNVDMNTPGAYTVHYKITDSDKLVDHSYLTVNVVEDGSGDTYETVGDVEKSNGFKKTGVNWIVE